MRSNGRRQHANGDIVTDFGLSVSGDTNKSVSGRIGAGDEDQPEHEQRRSAHQERVGGFH